MPTKNPLRKQLEIKNAILLKMRELRGEGSVKLGVQFTELKFNRAAIDEEARTIEIAFSSEDPYQRWYGIEILGHDATEVRLGRLQNGAPLLFNHNRDDHLGVIEDVKLENQRGRSLVRFGNSVLASEKFEDAKDGILTKVSVGYIVHKLLLVEDDDEGLPTYRATDWEPLENSFVTIAADDTVGTGKDNESVLNLMRAYEGTETIVDASVRKVSTETDDSIKTTTVEVIQVPDLTKEEKEKLEKEAQKTAREVETSRCREIAALGEQHGQVLPKLKSAATTAIRDGLSVEDFQRTVLAELSSDENALELQPATKLDLSGNEVERFSLIRAINAHATQNWKAAGFERECSDAIAERLDRDARGFFVPWEVQGRAAQRKIQERVMTVAGAATGAELVGTDHDAASFIDNLRASALLGQLGAIVLPGLVGNLDLPRKISSATFAFVAEDAGATLSDVGTGTLALTPKILAGATAMSRSLLKQSAPSVEDMVMTDLALGAALGVDQAGFQGSGAANNPTGVVNTTGIATSTIAAAGSPTWVETVEFETDVAAADGLNGSLAYVSTPAVKGSMKTTVKDSGSGRFIHEMNETNGYRHEVSSQLAANTIVFGNWNDVILAFWGVLDVVTDTATKIDSGGLVLRVFSDCDVGVRHALSFSKNA